MPDPTPETHPVINSPYEEPVRHWELDGDGRALPNLMQGRRVSAFRSMVPQASSGPRQSELLAGQERFDEFVNRVRAAVADWRRAGYTNISTISKELLQHWKSSDRNSGPRHQLFFAQVEALEALIWLYEARPADTEFARNLLAQQNEGHNEGCNRLAVRMATGTGKTTVMAMLIIWHTLHAVYGSKTRREQHARTFLVLTPGKTVKERLQELDPNHLGNIYSPRGENLLPAKYQGDIQQACVRIVNFQAFRQRDLLAGASTAHRAMFNTARRRRGMPEETQREDYGSMLARVMNLPSGPQHHKVVVLNDEAHHCYAQPPVAQDAAGSAATSEHEYASGEVVQVQRTRAGRRARRDGDDTQAEAEARQWFGILRGLRDQGRLLVAHDLSATPYYVSNQSLRFSWILSDYDLHEAMEAGLVKIPRVPVYDDASAGEDVKWRELYKNTEPKRLQRDRIPPLVEHAMQALFSSYEARVAEWQQVGHENLPVLIVVANDIKNATALYDWIAGYQTDEGWVEGAFAALSNVEGGRRKPNPVTMLVHSDRLEDEATAQLTGTGADRMRLVAEEVAEARGEEDEATNNINKAEYLRRILATVGKEGQPGEGIRCVVSVSMLTEGWDARTVTHILGFRAFNSHLLSEQVAGRALRRVNYESSEDGEFKGELMLPAEYAEILGIPFRFSEAAGPPPPPPDKTIEVVTQEAMEAYRISWPCVEAYRRTAQPGDIRLNPDKAQPFDATVTPKEPTEALLGGAIGDMAALRTPEERQQFVIYRFARFALHRLAVASNEDDTAIPPTLRRFAQLALAAREWLALDIVQTSEPWWQLLSDSLLESALDSFLAACEIDSESLAVAVDLGEPQVLDTSGVHFITSISGERPGGGPGPIAYPARPDPNRPRANCARSELNVAVCDSDLEWRIAEALDSDQLEGVVLAWARNNRLGWQLPWLDREQGAWRHYVPDFVVRLTDCPETGQRRHVVLEGKGFPDESWPAKREAMLQYWLPGVNASTEEPCAGLWTLLEVRPAGQSREYAARPELACSLGDMVATLRRLNGGGDAWQF